MTRLLTVGADALLIELDSTSDVVRLRDRLPATLEGLAGVIPGARTLLVRFDSRADLRQARPLLAELARSVQSEAGDTGSDRDGAADGPDPRAEAVRIEVVYDGEDLVEVSRATGLEPDRIVAAHSGVEWVAAFPGFAPGFAYLVPEPGAAGTRTAADLQRLLAVPRRVTPRTRVPAGSVALAGGFSAVYPQASPGGWHLVGRTAAPLWRTDRTDGSGRPAPALLGAGSRVRFVPVEELSEPSGLASGDDARDRPAADGAAADGTAADRAPGLLVEDAGLQTLVEDLGRPGGERWGVSPSGVLDPEMAAALNAALGNAAGAPVLENIGGLALRARGHHRIAVGGAASAVITGPDGERPLECGRAAILFDGEVVTIAAARTGLRSWVAIRGGFTAPDRAPDGAAPVLGSWSADLLSGLGPGAVQVGDFLPAGCPSGSEPAGIRAGAPAGAPTLRPGAAAWPAAELERQLAADGAVTLNFVPGPRDDWFAPAELERLADPIWEVTAESNRVGLRLRPVDGASPRPLRRTEATAGAELPSEPLVTGAIQVPPSGEPILFLTDRPVTGGYPVLGVVVPRSLRLAAQLAPGTRVRFAAVDPDRAASGPPVEHPSGGAPAREAAEAGRSSEADRSSDARASGEATVSGEAVAEVRDDVVRVGLTVDGRPVTIGIPLDVIQELAADE